MSESEEASSAGFHVRSFREDAERFVMMPDQRTGGESTAAL